MAVVAVVIIMGGVMAMVMAVVAAAVVMAPGKNFEKNPEKSFLWKKGGFPSGLLM